LSVATVGACIAALLLGSATAAAAASAPAPVAAKPHLVTLDGAFAALPTAKQLPGDVRLVEKVQLPTQGQLSPCPELLFNSLGDVAVKAGTAGALFEPAHHQTPAAKTATWAVSALVFHSAKQAKDAGGRLLALEKICPKKLGGQGLPVDIARTHAGAYAVDGWTGYRSVDEASSLNLVDGPEPEGVRVTQVFLVKGNVMLSLIEQGGIQPGTAVRQEAWRKTVTKVLFTAFDTLQS
jgi:hypothetical protein